MFSLDPELVIGIVDESLGCLVTWLEGHSLVQTVFTNLYLHQPDKVRTSLLSLDCF